MHRKQRENPHGSRWRLVVAISMVAAATLLVLVRFPPADLAGWVSTALGAPLGVPYLVASSFCLVSMWLSRGTAERSRRTLGRISAVGAAATAIIGILLLNEHI